MKIHILNTNYCEEWSYDNPESQGIGGSETAAIEYAWRFARRGHDVRVYAPVPWDGEKKWRGTTWTHFKNADCFDPGVWFLFRNPEKLDYFTEHHPGQLLMLIAQDCFYHDATEERLAKLDHYVCLCRDHAREVGKRHPCVASKIVVSRNGLKTELVAETLAKNLKRDPYKLIYASSPDRGLENLAKVFTRAKEYIPQLHLEIFYGFDNMDSVIEKGTALQVFVTKNVKQRIQEAIAKPGITFHGRTPQPKLYEELATASLWPYCTNFTETGCIQAYEAQALGAIPITNPIWALRDYVYNGVLIEGNPDRDPLVRSRYVGEVLRLTSDVELQDKIRSKMMAEAVEKLGWEGVIAQLEEIAERPISTEPRKEMAIA